MRGPVCEIGIPNCKRSAGVIVRVVFGIPITPCALRVRKIFTATLGTSCVDRRQHLRDLPETVYLVKRLHNVIDNERDLGVEHSVAAANDRLALAERVPGKTDTGADAAVRGPQRFPTRIDLISQAVVQRQVRQCLPCVLAVNRIIRQFAANDAVAKALLIRLGKSEVERLNRVDRSRRELRADQTSRQRTESEPAAEKRLRIEEAVTQQEAAAELEPMASAYDRKIINGLVTAVEIKARQKDVAVEKAEPGHVQLRPVSGRSRSRKARCSLPEPEAHWSYPN